MPKVRYQKFITREDVRANRKSLYVFGDNVYRAGLGGQAGAMRGEPNSVGIATKWSPGTGRADYFKDGDPGATETIVRDLIYFSVMATRPEWTEIVVPTDGIGTGLSRMPVTCPQLFKMMMSKFNELLVLFEDDDNSVGC